MVTMSRDTAAMKKAAKEDKTEKPERPGEMLDKEDLKEPKDSVMKGNLFPLGVLKNNAKTTPMIMPDTKQAIGANNMGADKLKYPKKA